MEVIFILVLLSAIGLLLAVITDLLRNIKSLLEKYYFYLREPKNQEPTVTLSDKFNSIAIENINKNIEYLTKEYNKHFKPPKTAIELQQEKDYCDKISRMKKDLDEKVKAGINDTKK